MSGTRSAVQRPRSDALSECHHAFKWTVLPCMQEVLARLAACCCAGYVMRHLTRVAAEASSRAP